MELVIIGINHKTAPVEVRERLSFSSPEIIEAGRRLKSEAYLPENLILSTCNRVEIYALAHRDKDYVHDVQNFLSKFHNLKISDFKDRIYIHKDKKAIEHLFSVAAGLDSMVIGEMEILGQVKKAYHEAKINKATGKILNRLFEKAFNTAKKIRTETFIGRGAVSVSSAAVGLAEKILGGLEGKTALIIGTGVVGEQLLLYLKKNGVKSLLVANRTLEKAQELAQRFQAEAVDFKDFKNKLACADIVITSTGAPHCIIGRADIANIMPKRKQKPLFIIDLAVPRDVEEEVNKIDSAYLFNIDDLQKIVEGNLNVRKGELDSCSKIINDSSARFIAWMDKEKIRNAV